MTNTFRGIFCFFGLAGAVGCSSALPAGTSSTGGATGVGGRAGSGVGGAAGGGLSGSAGSGGGAAGSTWIDRTAGTAAALLPWLDVASDATGTRLVAVTTVGNLDAQGDVWTSVDAGVTWTNRTKGTAASGQFWQSVASDSAGTHLVAVTRVDGIPPGGEDVWTSADAGATWTKRTTVNSTAGLVVGPTVASDATGTHLVLADGDVWTSDDAGATWTDRTAGTSAAAQGWLDVASDATATHLVAVAAHSDIWTSADAGATWINRTKGTEASGREWQSVATDSTGTRLVAVCNPSVTSGGVLYSGDIWTSADSGATWTNQTAGTAATGHLWFAVASDATGAHLVAACAHGNANDIWTSADSGATWTNETGGTVASGQQWITVASDATGAHLVAISSGGPGGGPCCFGDIWTD